VTDTALRGTDHERDERGPISDEKSDSAEDQKENWRQRTWRTAKRVAKWQILRYIVQILLCLVLVRTRYH
jgi:hypothetical protein